MLKAIKTKLLSSSIDNYLQTLHIDATHSFVKYSDFMQICRSYQKPKQRAEILSHLSNKLFNCPSRPQMKLSHLIYKIKLMLLTHQLLKQNLKDPQLQEILLNYNQELITAQDFGSSRIAKSDKIEEFEIFRFIHNEIFVVYGQYVKKFCANLQSIIFISQFTNWSNNQKISQKKKLVLMDTQEQATMMQCFQSIQLINHGFTILNLGNCILSMKDALNKMGRYHEEFNEMKSIFLVLAKDLDSYNNYIKRSLAVILRRNIDKQEIDQQNDRKKLEQYKKPSKSRSKSKKKSSQHFETELKKIEDLSVSNISLKTVNPNIIEEYKKTIKTVKVQDKEVETKKKEKEEINHGYLYMCECQKLSDKLYCFFYNRYFYKKMGDDFTFPSFLKLDVKYENIMKNRLKRYDRQLLHLIKESKFDDSLGQTRKRSRTNDFMNKTEVQNQTRTSTIGVNRINYTMCDKEDEQDLALTRNSLQLYFPEYDFCNIKKPVEMFITEE